MTPGDGHHRPLCPDGRRVPDEEATAPCPPPSRPYVLAATILASAMAFIDGSIVTIALPAIQSDLGADFAASQWVVNGYALFLATLILVGGSGGDRYGRRRVFVLGIALFAVASVACALAPGVRSLIAARCIQGIGAALLVPQSLAILAATFPKAVRGRAIGIWAGASAVTTALGPALGGMFVDLLGWRSIFWINVPLSVAAIALALRHVPESRDEDTRFPPDWIGGVLAVLGFGLLTVALTHFSERRGTAAAAAIMAAAGVAALVAFVRVERTRQEPLVPLALFADRTFTIANVMTLFLYGALTAVLFLLPFELIERRGLSATEVGLTLLPLGLLIGGLSRFAGDWADRRGARLPLAAGSLLVAIAAGMLALGIKGYAPGILVPVILLSLGMATVVAPLTTAVMNAAPDSRSGAASGINNAASRLAGLFAVALAGATASVVYTAALDSGAAIADPRFGVLPPAEDAARAAATEAFGLAYRSAMALASLWALLAAGSALGLGDDSRQVPIHRRRGDS